MTNNSQMIDNLRESVERKKRENELIIQEIINKSLNVLNESLINTYSTKLDNIENSIKQSLTEQTEKINKETAENLAEIIEITKQIPQDLSENARQILYETQGETQKFSKFVMILSFSLGFLTMLIIYLAFLR